MSRVLLRHGFKQGPHTSLVHMQQAVALRLVNGELGQLESTVNRRQLHA